MFAIETMTINQPIAVIWIVPKETAEVRPIKSAKMSVPTSSIIAPAR